MTSFVGGNAFLLSVSTPVSPIPAPAQNVGYTQNTFKSTSLVNTPGNMYYCGNFYGYAQPPALGQPGAVATQNADGSFTLTGSTTALISSAQYSAGSQGKFVGVAFGGGCYVECTLAWNPGTGAAGSTWPAFWFNDIETMAYNAVTSANVWPGLTATLTAGSPNITLNFPTAGNYAVGSVDAGQYKIIFTEILTPILTKSGSKILTEAQNPILATNAAGTGTVTGITLGQTYYIVSVGTNSVQVSATQGGAAITLGGTGTATCGLGFGDWIEIDTEYDTGSTTKLGYALHSWNGYLSGDVQTHTSFSPYTVITGSNTFANPNKFGMLWVPATATTPGYVTWYFNNQPTYTQTWNQYDPTLLPPPVLGSSAFSVLDTRHIAILFGTSTVYPMTVSSVNVWQATAANNLVHSS